MHINMLKWIEDGEKMLDICLLGTGGMMPLPRRYLTSMMARYNGSNILIDCVKVPRLL